ncbi:MAG: AMP-binding protein [Oscillospiraceae bacterium]|jgi:fatty-acyl-CoA synthase|nr:AMP-binding protein [Oscillospiraceae bacterium]
MKLAFSTIGCPHKGWTETCKLAREEGFHGFEVRDLGPEALTYEKFVKANSIATKKELKEMGLILTCFSIGKSVKKHGRDITAETSQKQIRAEAREYIKTASNLGCPFVRLQIDDYTKNVDNDDVVADALNELVPFAEALGVTLLIETKGIYKDTARLGSLLSKFRSDSVGALWDIDHTFHSGGESPETTVTNLGAMIKYVHLRDSEKAEKLKEYKRPGSVYRAMGEGDLPIADTMLALRSISFDGYLSFEWLGSDVSDEPFRDFVRYMTKNFLRCFDTDELLFESDPSAKYAAGEYNWDSGKYFWEKESVINYTLPAVLDRIIERFPDKTAFSYTVPDHTGTLYKRTYQEFHRDVDRFARSLIALGVRSGDKVAIWSPNLPEWYVTFWATVKIGAVLVTVNTAYKIREAEYLLRQSDTRVLVMADKVKDSDYIGIIKKLCPELASLRHGEPLYSQTLPFLRHVITIESEQVGCHTWEAALECAGDVSAEELAAFASKVKPNDVCNMQYTSGTTGFPKGVMLTHYNIVNNGKNIGDRMDLSTADRMMIHVPMFHCFGMVLAMTAAMTHGVTMYPIPSFSPRISLACINENGITAFHGVPTMFIAMLEHEDFPKTDFSRMRTGIMAGSPCPVAIMQKVIEQMHMPEITIVFGQTESSPGCTMSNSSDSIDIKVSTVGGALPGIECRIVDPDTGEQLPDDTDGEFVARGYNIMKGYYKMPGATASAIDKDGWLHTGDLARRLPDGNFKITGRIKDMIIRGGENIYPKEIEDFIYTHPKVKDVQVIGVPDKQYGEEIMAWVIPKAGEVLTEDDVKDYVRGSMAKHKTPRYVRFVSEFIMNAAGKVMKYKMVQDSVAYLGLEEAAKVETA